MGVVPVEAQSAEAQVGGLAEQVEELGRVQAEVAVVYAELLVVGIGGCVQGQVEQLLLDALALRLGGIERAADVLAGIFVAEVVDSHAAGLAPDVLAAPAPHGVLRSGAGIVVEGALQAALKVQHELLELAHHAGQGRGSVGVARFGVAGSSVSLQQGHWGGAVGGCSAVGGQSERLATGLPGARRARLRLAIAA